MITERWWRSAAGIAGLATALLFVAAALLPARSAAAVPLEGDASWVWYVSASGGSGKAIGAAAARRGLDAVYVKSGDGVNYWSQFSPELVDAIHSRGVDVCAWQFVYGDDPEREARIAARAVDAGADCLIIDAEGDYEGKYAAADTYIRALRGLVGDSYPLALSSFPYVDYHPSFPYSVFLGPGGAQYNVPQLYWYAIGTPVVTGFSHTYSFNRPYDRPIYPVGQTYEDPPKGQLLDFRRYAREFGAKGISWWSWQETSGREWRRITKRVKRGIPGYRPDRDFAELGPGDEGDLVVWAQELLLGAGGDVSVNGEFDGRTKRAVVAIQSAAGLRASGAIDDRTWGELLEHRPARIRWAAPGAARTLRGFSASAPSAPRSAGLPPLAQEIPPPEERTG